MEAQQIGAATWENRCESTREHAELDAKFTARFDAIDRQSHRRRPVEAVTSVVPQWPRRPRGGEIGADRRWTARMAERQDSPPGWVLQQNLAPQRRCRDTNRRAPMAADTLRSPESPDGDSPLGPASVQPAISNKKIAAAGAFGGVATSLLDLVSKTRASGLPSLEGLGGEVFCMTILAIIGCGLVLVFEEKNMRKAFFLGIGAPALLVSAGTVTDRPQPLQGEGMPANQQQERPAEERSGAMSLRSWGVQVLYAAQSPSGETPQQDPSDQSVSQEPEPQESRKLAVRANVPVWGGIFILDASSDEERMIERDTDGRWTVPATEFRIVFRGMIEGRVPVETPVATVGSGSEPLALELFIETEQTFVGGVLDGFGLDNLAQEFRRSSAQANVVEVTASPPR